MIRMKYFDTLCDLTSYLITEGYTLQNFIEGLRYSLTKNPETVYFGTILQNMSIIVINDFHPNKVDYKDPSPDAYRDPVWLRVFCGGGYNPQEWGHMPTMAVDPAGNLYIGQQFLETQIYKEFPDDKDYAEVLKSILLHESMHISELTFFRGIGRQPLIWNIATDIYINLNIIRNGRKLPKCLYVPDANGKISFPVEEAPGVEIEFKYNTEGKTAEILYDELMDLLTGKKEPGGKPPPGKNPPIGKGDVVYNPMTREYGIVISANPPRTRVISEDEAVARVKSKSGVA